MSVFAKILKPPYFGKSLSSLGTAQSGRTRAESPSPVFHGAAITTMKMPHRTRAESPE
jgi:hypothetical protein